jgi:hypothetical protein
MDDDDEYRDHVAGINRHLVARAAALKKASQPADFGSGQKGEVVRVKKTDDDLETIDPANVRDGGEVSRS